MSAYPDHLRCPICDLLPRRWAWNENARCKCDDPPGLVDPDNPPELQPANKDKWRDD